MKLYIICFLYVTLFGGCTSLMLKDEEPSNRKLSCEETAKPKSLLYLEQQYRCSTSDED